MRFAELSQEATQQLWDKWKPAIREILDEFNEDVFHCKGALHENAYNERLYLLLETKKEFFYVFPMPDNLLILGVYHHKIPKEYLSLKFAGDKPEDGNRIAAMGLQVGLLNERDGETEDLLQNYLEKTLTQLYRNYCIKPIF